MSILNKPDCDTDDGNVGSCDCALAVQTMAGFMLVPLSFRLDATDLASKDSTLAALQAATKDVRSARVYPLPIVGVPTDNTQEATFETLPNGAIRFVKEGFYDLTTLLSDNSIYISNQLRKFNNRKLGLLFWDQQGTLWGLTKGTGLAPIPLELLFTDYKFATDQAGAQILSRLVFDKNTFLSGYGFAALDPADYLQITGLKSIQLNFISRAANVITLSAQILGCGDSLGDEYPTESVLNAIWSVVNHNTGAEIDITSVAYNTTTKNFTITVNASDTDYAAGTPMDVNLRAVATLEQNGIEGFESTGIITTT